LFAAFVIEAVNGQGKGHAKGHGKGKGKGNGKGHNKDKLTKSDLEDIKDDLNDIVQGPAIGRTVRLAFHDCVGGCDGCINENDPDNAGPMLDQIKILNQRYEDRSYADKLSRADFWQLAAIKAIEVGLANANKATDCGEEVCQGLGLNINFKLGRKDCTTSPTTTRFDGLPDGHLDHEGVTSFFREEFGLDAELATALLGAHTVGGASGALGFKGFWKENAEEATKFDNRYYRALLDRTIKFQQTARSFNNSIAWQWDGNNRDTNDQVSFMLHADAALVFDLQLQTPWGGGAASAGCTFESCPTVETFGEVREYAENDGFWMAEFSRAYEIMIHNKCDDCIDVEDF